jgi:hypothetical protein
MNELIEKRNKLKDQLIEIKEFLQKYNFPELDKHIEETIHVLDRRIENLSMPVQLRENVPKLVKARERELIEIRDEVRNRLRFLLRKSKDFSKKLLEEQRQINELSKSLTEAREEINEHIKNKFSSDFKRILSAHKFYDELNKIYYANSISEVQKIIEHIDKTKFLAIKNELDENLKSVVKQAKKDLLRRVQKELNEILKKDKDMSISETIVAIVESYDPVITLDTTSFGEGIDFKKISGEIYEIPVLDKIFINMHSNRFIILTISSLISFLLTVIFSITVPILSFFTLIIFIGLVLFTYYDTTYRNKYYVKQILEEKKEFIKQKVLENVEKIKEEYIKKARKDLLSTQNLIISAVNPYAHNFDELYKSLVMFQSELEEYADSLKSQN